ncbi:cytidylyltransferase domain-containing protein [Shigella flexneri]
MIPRPSFVRLLITSLSVRWVWRTLAVPIHNAEEAFNPSRRESRSHAQGYALYFSRATIPWDRDLLQKTLKPLAITSCVILVFLWLPCRLYPSLRHLAVKPVRTHRNVRAASCSVVRRKNPRRCSRSGSSWHRRAYPCRS